MTFFIYNWTKFLSSTGTIFSLSASNLSTSDYKLIKSVGKDFSLSLSSLHTSDFKSAKSFFLAFSTSDFVA